MKPTPEAITYLRKLVEALEAGKTIDRDQWNLAERLLQI